MSIKLGNALLADVTPEGVITTPDKSAEKIITLTKPEYDELPVKNAKTLYITVPPPTLQEASWDFIAQVAASGNASEYWAVGDKKDIELSTSEVITLVILGFDHDDLSDNSGKAGITFGMKNLLATKYPMNASNTNVGGWDGSVMRTSTMPNLLSKLPIDLQAVIKPVNKLTSEGNKSSAIVTSSDSLFLLSEIEARGATSYSFAGEGTQYEYYQGGVNADFVKKLSDGAGSVAHWWFRSPFFALVTSFCVTYGSGSNAMVIADNTNGVSFCFCI